MKKENIKFRCSIYEKKFLKIKAEKAGISVSEFCRNAIFNIEISERFSKDEINVYKTLIKYHNNFKLIGNMYRNRNPYLEKEVINLANEIKTHLNKFKK